MVARNNAIRIQNLREVQASLRALDASLPKELRAINKDAAEIIAEEARPDVPTRSGKLLRSLKAQAEQRVGKVKMGSPTRVPYAGPIHWGWPARNIEPQPVIAEALADRYDDVVEYYDNALRDLIQRAGLSRRFR